MPHSLKQDGVRMFQDGDEPSLPSFPRIKDEQPCHGIDGRLRRVVVDRYNLIDLAGPHRITYVAGIDTHTVARGIATTHSLPYRLLSRDVVELDREGMRMDVCPYDMDIGNGH